MYEFTIEANEYLGQDIRSFYHTDYVGRKKPGNPDYINTLKNTYNDYPESKLNRAVQELESVLQKDLSQILGLLELNSLTVCVVPRAKAEYKPNQLLFKSTVRNMINELNGFHDGTDYIKRHTNTKTTHFKKEPPNINNDGPEPYPGITIATCEISDNVKGKDVLLVDDIYTRTVNIDEDAIQALLDHGVNSVIFYAIGCTKRKEY